MEKGVVNTMGEFKQEFGVVKLVAFTKPTREMYSEGLQSAEDLVAYCARVSNPSNQFNLQTATKLVQYLIKHAHWSPLEMVSATVEIETTRDIARQILRHRSFSFQEFSQRYAEPKALGDVFTTREARLQDTKNRQNSIMIDENDEDQLSIAREWSAVQRRVIEASREAYDWAISNGIAKEQARAVLPEGLTKTRMYMAGTLRSWIHYIQLRSANGTQKEHMDIARVCAQVIAEAFPLIERFASQE
jgi:thymidylate synthase (FAD)